MARGRKPAQIDPTQKLRGYQPDGFHTRFDPRTDTLTPEVTEEQATALLCRAWEALGYRVEKPQARPDREE